MATDPIDTVGSPTVYIGSHLKAEAFGGMNGDPNASSLLPGQTVKRGSVGKSLIGTPDPTLAAIATRGVNDQTQVAAPDYDGSGSSQTRPVSTKQYPSASGMRHRGGQDGSPGGKVGSSTRPVTTKLDRQPGRKSPQLY
jgi:hypothetical protein